MKNPLPVLIIPLFFIPGQALQAQPAPAAEQARLDQSRQKILRTAEALGITVYEDLPAVSGGPSAPRAQALPATVPPAAPALPPEVPAPAQQEPPPGNTMSKGNKLGYLVLAWHSVAAQVADSGLLFWRHAAPGFDAISESVETSVKRSAYSPRRAGESSLLEDPGFAAEMEDLTGARFSGGGTARALIDGPASFAVKDALIRGAKRSIYIASYAIYDDVTGSELTAMLLAKKREGVEIKVMVDEKMSHIFGGGQLKELDKAGVETVLYRDAGRPHDYLHVKLLIVDGENAVVGGMNYGDEYSHKGPGLKWRDTDVLYTGPAVDDSVKAFAALWNPLAGGRGRVEPPSAPQRASGPARIAVLPQNPPSMKPPILAAIIKAMSGATRNINIENAYIVAIPAVNRAVQEARARGVEVNILTNSKESIDSDGKSMADTIVEGTKVFAAAGANVYLKRGQTLHSKFMTVDGVFTCVGSYNLHPRSERYDTEMNIAVLDRGAAAEFDEAFYRDIAEAKKMTLEELNKKKPGWFSRLVGKVGFSQLSRGLRPGE
ncbi:MAG: phosphatidylserine/phosphatidylglycerophosphate/cardiolipin synthase family protein [Elusimicrobia bacterium]|nr:phosphatidylserine/phosphatidylglycerophosphate/cardiolipin synthase family protein [Elusimicrobiota bacterium]